MALSAPVQAVVKVAKAADKRFDFGASVSAAFHSVWAVASGVIVGVLTTAASTSFNDGSLICSGAFASPQCSQSFVHHGLYGVAAGVIIGVLVRGSQRGIQNQKIQEAGNGSSS